ncbi:MAG: hypothetical protein Q8O56_13815 [Solirubrobacteraceae bacterium]|nr:hypothetical protein [Solirubrobacteraceae bacterium]
MLISVRYWQAVCDACAMNLTEDGEYSAWAHPESAVDDVDGSEGIAVEIASDPPGQAGYLIVCRICVDAYVAELEQQDAEAGDRAIENVARGCGDAIARLATWAQGRQAMFDELSPSGAMPHNGDSGESP